MSELPTLTDEQLKALAEFYAGEGGWQTPHIDELMELGLVDYEVDFDGYTMWVTALGEKVLEASGYGA